MPTLGDRLHRAILAHQSQIGRRVTYAELGAAIAKEEGREKPYTAAAVSEWIQGRGEPKLGAIQAMARVLNVPAEWMAFGGATPPTSTADLNARTATKPPNKPPTTTKAAPGKAANDKRKGR